MPRWYSLCDGSPGFPACAICRRHASNNGTAREEARQGMTAPDIDGKHCNRFMELPPAIRTAASPTPQVTP